MADCESASGLAENESIEKSEPLSSNEKDEIRKIKLMKLMDWINKYMKIEMTDGRILIGTFVCTDKDANVILSACSELFNTEKTGISEEPRMLGLVMIPGRHIVSIHLEKTCPHEMTNSKV